MTAPDHRAIREAREDVALPPLVAILAAAVLFVATVAISAVFPWGFA